MDLRSYCRQNDISAAEFARRIEVTRQAANRYIKKERIPNRAVMLRIVDETGGKVTAADFYQKQAAE